MLSFSIVIPAFNSAGYIADSIESVVSTKYDPNKYEIIVVDDGSTDNTVDIIKQLQKRYANLKLFQKPNGNWGSVINFVKNNKLITNDYTVILDSDDKLSPNFFTIVNNECKNANVFLMALKVHGKRLTYYVSPYWFLLSRNVSLEKRFTVGFAPFSIVVKSDLFYEATDLREKVSYQDSHLYYDLLNKANTVRFTYRIAGDYIKYRPGNTMSASWTDKRMKEEILLHKDLKELNLAHHATLRVLMSGYRKKAKELNYKIEMNEEPSGFCFPLWLQPLFWLVKKVVLQKYIDVKKSSDL